MAIGVALHPANLDFSGETFEVFGFSYLAPGAAVEIVEKLYYSLNFIFPAAHINEERWLGICGISPVEAIAVDGFANRYRGGELGYSK